MEFTNASTGNPGSTNEATVLRYSDLFQNSDKIPRKKILEILTNDNDISIMSITNAGR